MSLASLMPRLTGADRALQRRSEGAHGRWYRPKHGLGSLYDGMEAWCSGAAPQEPGIPFGAPDVPRSCPARWVRIEHDRALQLKEEKGQRRKEGRKEEREGRERRTRRKKVQMLMCVYRQYETMRVTGDKAGCGAQPRGLHFHGQAWFSHICVLITFWELHR